MFDEKLNYNELQTKQSLETNVKQNTKKHLST